MDERIKDLNLLLLYLCGWQEDSRQTPGEKVFRSWKGFLFNILNQLEEEKMIRQIKGGKSLIITDAGLHRAQQLKEKMLNGSPADRTNSTSPIPQETTHAGKW
jgi:hypothetical protein